VACPVLLVIGAVAEFIGIVLLGFPDFLPGARRLSGWLRRTRWRVINPFRRLAGLPPRRGIVYAKSGTLAAGVGMRAAGMVSTSATTLEDKVEYLLRRDQNAQREANALAMRVGRLEAESSRRLAELRRQMEEHFDVKLTSALQEYRPLRIAGAVALSFGLVCVTATSLLT
jgi:hypothetical protein